MKKVIQIINYNFQNRSINNSNNKNLIQDKRIIIIKMTNKSKIIMKILTQNKYCKKKVNVPEEELLAAHNPEEWQLYQLQKELVKK